MALILDLFVIWVLHDFHFHSVISIKNEFLTCCLKSFFDFRSGISIRIGYAQKTRVRHDFTEVPGGHLGAIRCLQEASKNSQNVSKKSSLGFNRSEITEEFRSWCAP